MAYKQKLSGIMAFNQERTKERFGYDYPLKAKQKISLNCESCKREGQLQVADLFTRLKKRGQYLCSSCSAFKREDKSYTIDWLSRCNQVQGYAAEVTEQFYGYQYPKRSTDPVCVSCACGFISHQPIGEFYRKSSYRCKSCMAKDEFDGRQANLYAARDLFWDKPENRAWASDLAKKQTHRSETMTKLNSNDDFKKNRLDGYYEHIEDIKKAQSEASKNLWETRYEEMAEYARQTAPGRAVKLRENMADPIKRSHYSAKGKANWDNAEYRKKQSESWTEDRRKRMSQKHSDPEFLKKITKNRKPTTEEGLLEYFFNSLGLTVLPQHVLGFYIFDVFLPELNVLIEFDGLRWHHPDYAEGNARKNLKRDKSKSTYVKRYYPDLRLYRFTENEIYQKKFLETTFQHLIKEQSFNFDDLTLRKVEDKEANLFLTLFHYKENQRAAPGLKLGAFYQDNLISIAVYSSVSRQEIATSMGYKSKEILELSRFCIHPAYHKKNFGSWFLARSREQVRTLYPYVRGIATFADTTLDHEGTIYKAAGYTMVREVPEDYHYQHEISGKFMHKRTLWGLAKKMREAEDVYARKHGFNKVWGQKKLKFFFSFDKD